ncbi:unnamed protein product [Kuraishia capsulata CBS 1993]|uniref:rRNA-processing protein FYV7 n=1 Tax=Kuraishia capsulata CBS 1993 TaxID=1382522 RepID=W6MUN9_9ASCO|nr:uncharacterized protein KUCA_T00001765001 [Kuraishia capsulata CBS 1993]CDK25795.1 unnamed protein product [Kuraishia capsulata CBS 1993]
MARTNQSHGQRPKKIYDRETKSSDIKRSLTHKSNLRKNYFKLLEREGEQLPERDQEQASESKPTLTYQERAKLARERKERKRQDKIETTKRNLQDAKRKRIEREQKKEKLLKAKTKTGQPLMGPRISNLLEKIKKDL